jgi:hypothetical protein
LHLAVEGEASDDAKVVLAAVLDDTLARLLVLHEDRVELAARGGRGDVVLGRHPRKVTQAANQALDLGFLQLLLRKLFLLHLFLPPFLHLCVCGCLLLKILAQVLLRLNPALVEVKSLVRIVDSVLAVPLASKSSAVLFPHPLIFRIIILVILDVKLRKVGPIFWGLVQRVSIFTWWRPQRWRLVFDFDLLVLVSGRVSACTHVATCCYFACCLWRLSLPDVVEIGRHIRNVSVDIRRLTLALVRVVVQDLIEIDIVVVVSADWGIPLSVILFAWSPSAVIIQVIHPLSSDSRRTHVGIPSVRWRQIRLSLLHHGSLLLVPQIDRLIFVINKPLFWFRGQAEIISKAAHMLLATPVKLVGLIIILAILLLPRGSSRGRHLGNFVVELGHVPFVISI